MSNCPDAILRLIERFGHQLDQVRSPDYNETQVRIDFVNPMFRELGWDIDNRQGYAEQYREVVHEDRVKVAGATKAPDYSFRVGGNRKFFLEAKKPFVNIKDLWEPAYQLRRYAWSAKLAVSLLTDFEGLAIYDCRIQPKQFDKASVARREYIGYHQYPQKWDFLASTFSKDAVLRGDFDRYCGATRGRGAQEFDEAFLEEIEEWRKKLASNLALRNDALDERSLNFAVQRIIDRIIFLRICEDRGIEHVGQLRALVNSEEIYPRLCKLFRDADDRYNSGLFYFRSEKGRDEPPDELTPGLDIDDATLNSIIRRLYYPESPYEFTVVSADILGSVYERFLGKVITLTAGHRAKIDEKPEVRKAGGVYYTPTYIVDYIVQQTVGKLLEGKTPKDAAKLKVLDPACGSGSFLIGAYQYLLDWHLKWYIEHDPQKWCQGRNATLRPAAPPEDPAASTSNPSPQTPTPAYRLTIKERKRILLDNIHGVDIDYQAVEVTKLSLLLKVLEGETAESLGGLYRLFHERALPDLAHNIQCGNSLIGTDIMASDAWKQMSEDERRRVNPFDYERAFPQVFKQGGFDAVIGNPPYVRQEGVSADKAYFEATYTSYHGLADLYVYFLERGVALLRNGGLLSVIVSGKFTHAGYGRALRQFLLQRRIEQVIDYADVQIFAGATTYPLVIVIANAAPPTGHRLLYSRARGTGTTRPDDIRSSAYEVAFQTLGASPWAMSPAAGQSAIEKLTRQSRPLHELFGRTQLGIKTSLNEAFIVDSETAASLCREDRRSAELLKPYLRGRDIEAWWATGNGTFMVCTRESVRIADFPAIQKHLRSFEPALRRRYEVRRGDYDWWVIRQVADVEVFENPKIVYPDLCAYPQYALNTDSAYPNNTLFCIRTDSRPLLALLNSKLGWYWVTQNCPANRGGARRLFNQYMNCFPVRPAAMESEKLG